ncbi:MAG: competence/damage-inducible protein A [Chloroflexi bacterium HGW-Chloroflexi-10]|jgi:competence/damage-inducible protein CinA-like protein|nr:MAG: competence/damage-inducible protein A [Chloroflexi bacterium HGW-Chloroflexi-10]
MPVAEIITIGTELLLGEIQDTNTRHIARVLRNAGIDLYRTTIVGDNQNRIAMIVKEAVQRCNIIITTGGLGPTIDDPTRTAIAQAMGVETEFRPDLWDHIQTRFLRYGRVPTENNRRQAYIPQGATPIENPVGTAPSFMIETPKGVLISLPGVPREMEYLLENAVMPLLKERFKLEGIIKTFLIHLSGAGESQIDEIIGDLELLSNPTVGLVAHPGEIDIRVTAKAISVEQADKMIAEIVQEIEHRLGNNIFGYNETSIEQVVANLAKTNNQRIAVISYAIGETLKTRLSAVDVLDDRTIILDHLPDTKELENLVKNLYKMVNPNIVLGIALANNGQGNCSLNLHMMNNDQLIIKQRSFGGHENLSISWAENTALDLIRRQFC